MDKVQRFINNSHKLYYSSGSKNMKYIPQYIIRKYIRSNPHKYFELGFIYQYYYGNYERMHEYYNKSLDDANTLLHLGLHYGYFAYNDKEMAECFKKAVKLGNSYAMTYLAVYYEAKEYDYNLTETYYLYAITLGNSEAMFYLGHYYDGKNYELMKHYNMLAIKLNNSQSIINCMHIELS